MAETKKAAEPETTAASLLGLTQTTTEPEDEDETVIETEPETEEEPETEPEADDEATDPEPEDDEEEETNLVPPEELLEALKDKPKELKRLKDAYKGLAKKDKQLAIERQNVAGLVDYGRNLMNVQTYESTLQQIASEVSQQHGVKPEYVLGNILKRLAPTEEMKTEPVTPDDVKFDYEGDEKVYKAALQANEKRISTLKDEAKREVLEALGVDPAEFKSVLSTLKLQQAERAEQAWVETNAPKIKAKADKTLGWSVTDKMIQEAHKEFPNESDLIQALKKSFPDEYVRARTKTVPKKGPEIVTGSVEKSKPITNPADMTFAKLHALNNT